MGMLLNMTCFIVWKIKYHNKSFTNYKYLHLYILGKGTMGNGTFKNVSGWWDISIIRETGHSMLWEKGHFILWETGISIIWEQFYPLGIGTLILWESDHLSSGIRDILWETGNGKRYPLGIGPLILWEISSGNRELGNRFLTIRYYKLWRIEKQNLKDEGNWWRGWQNEVPNF